MKKGSTLLLILASVGIVCLLGLAGYVTLYLNDTLRTSDYLLEQAKAQETQLADLEPETAVTFHDSSDGEPLQDHFFIFVGDSRTVGMRDAVLKENDTDTCIYIARSGEGLYWFREEGRAELESSLSVYPDATVILNLGVNDLGEIEQYILCYQDLFAAFPDADFHIMSVNPVEDDRCIGASNQEIETFNTKMLETFPTYFLNSYNYLLTNGFETVDGLHYPDSVYRKIHAFAVATLNK